MCVCISLSLYIYIYIYISIRAGDPTDAVRRIFSVQAGRGDKYI